MLDEKQVRHVAKLARIALTEKEVKKFTGQLSKVLDYMEILKEVDTKNVAETSQVTGLDDVFEMDEPKSGQSSSDELLKCTELPIDSNQVRVMHAIK
jgi:aspartyl-tRNA(Asn)/glutamyl-tRNA(Gln) amidotransferase subunit C